MEHGIDRRISDPRKYCFLMPYPTVLGFGAKIILPLRRVYERIETNSKGLSLSLNWFFTFQAILQSMLPKESDSKVSNKSLLQLVGDLKNFTS